MSGLPSYESAQKQSHRGWVWNRMVDRLSVHPRDAVALYLLGPDDIDRRVAIAKGFRGHNLIGVDLSPECVAASRDDGGLAVQGRLQDVMLAWKSLPVNVLYVDSCSSLDIVPKVLESLIRSEVLAESSVMAINLQRGRECVTRPILDTLSHVVLPDGEEVGLHRGRMAFVLLMKLIHHFEKERSAAIGRQYGVTLRELAELAWAWCEPVFASYQNPGGVYMDSLVMRFASQQMVQVKVPSKPRIAKAMGRRLAAMKAVRTMRITGVLK